MEVGTAPKAEIASVRAPRGLSEAEAVERRARGLGNTVSFGSSRPFRQILRENAFTSIHVTIFAIGIALILLGLVSDALVTVGLISLNIAIAVIQETRAKRALDRIALLTRPTATVIRDGHERTVDPSEIVVGDTLVVGPGDQVVVDGQVNGDGRMDVDESLLTGESVPVAKRAGDPLYSGSFCVSGRATYEAQRVGMAGLANQLTARARTFVHAKTPVQREVNLVLRVMVVLILVIGGPIAIDLVIRALGLLVDIATIPAARTIERAYQGYSLEETVRSAAVIVGLLPQGLALMLTVTYAIGALRLVGKRVLLQQANAIESLSHVDVLCLDKTGTLTTNRLAFHALHPGDAAPADLAAVLGDYAASTTSRNQTIDAMAETFPGQSRRISEEVPFASSRKWSAIVLDDAERRGVYVLGAPEVLAPQTAPDGSLLAQLDVWTKAGLRVLLLAHQPEVTSLSSADGEPELPSSLAPLALVSFTDELNAEVRSTIAQFREAGIQLKLISGDHPDTVAALARQAGLDLGPDARTVSGLDLAAMEEGEVAGVAEEAVIFGRIGPEQKLELVRHLQCNGHYVAMIGDGVNDVLALKQAQIGVAMEHGSQATRAVADIVLLDGSFGALPAAFREGRRIVSGIQDLIKLFLARSLSVAFLILGAAVVGAAFPVTPKLNTIPAVLVVGIPTLGLAAWARAGTPPRELLRAVLPFALPAALTIGAVEVSLYLAYLRVTDDVLLARTVMTTVAVLCGLLLIPFVQPPTERWVGGDELSGDWRPTAMAAAMLVLFGAVMAIPDLRAFFELVLLSPMDLVVIGLVVTGWAFGIRYMWRRRLLQRFLGLSDEDRWPMPRA